MPRQRERAIRTAIDRLIVADEAITDLLDQRIDVVLRSQLVQLRELIRNGIHKMMSAK